MSEYEGLYCWLCGRRTGNTDECVRCAMIRLRAEQRDVRNVEDPPYSPLLDGPAREDEGF